ncbi:SGNH hydrolase-type esterase domain-containing protein [Haematococcus lacustris]
MPPPSPQPETIDIWILAGQSNMVGENAVDGTDGSLLGPDCFQPAPGRLRMFPISTYTWTDARPCVGCISNGCAGSGDACRLVLGPDMAFGNALLAANVSSRVGFVPTALGGTSLNVDWAPNTPGGLYGRMINATRAAMAAAGPNARLRGMLWVQGESDALHPAGGYYIAAAYAQNMRNFMARARQDLAPFHPKLPVIMAMQAVTNRDTIFPWIWILRFQQEELMADASQQPLLAVDMEGLSFFYQVIGGSPPQWVHLSHLGVCQLGRAMAARYITSGLAAAPPS